MLSEVQYCGKVGLHNEVQRNNRFKKTFIKHLLVGLSKQRSNVGNNLIVSFCKDILKRLEDLVDEDHKTN